MMESDSYWVEYFISVIESKPILYDKGLQEISDRESRKQSWNEVCHSVIENWDNLTPQEKTIKYNDIQQRWKNLRSCFTRELREQKRDANRPVPKKRRKYIYFNQLMFLLPHLDYDHGVPTSSNVTQIDTECGDSNDNDNDNSDTALLHDEKPLWMPRPLYPRRKMKYVASSNSKEEKRRTSFWEDTSVLGVNSKKEDEEFDEDKLFLLSILPDMQRLNNDKKYDLKIEILKIMKVYCDPGSPTPAEPTVESESPENKESSASET